MLEFCEEPYLCRRKVLLNYLDEDFRSKECNVMCDNCKKDLQVAEIDFTEHARYIVALIESSVRKKLDLTVFQICKFLMGKKQDLKNPSKNTKLDEMKSIFFGKLRGHTDDHIKRLIMKLLVNKILRESFSTYQVEQTLLVYLKLGRNFERFKKGQFRIMLTDCTEKDCEKEYKKTKRKEDRDFKKQYEKNLVENGESLPKKK